MKGDLRPIYPMSNMLTNTTADLSFMLLKSVYHPPQIQGLLHITASYTGVMVFQILAFLLGKQKAVRC